MHFQKIEKNVTVLTIVAKTIQCSYYATNEFGDSQSDDMLATSWISALSKSFWEHRGRAHGSENKYSERWAGVNKGAEKTFTSDWPTRETLRQLQYFRHNKSYRVAERPAISAPPRPTKVSLVSDGQYLCFQRFQNSYYTKHRRQIDAYTVVEQHIFKLLCVTENLSTENVWFLCQTEVPAYMSVSCICSPTKNLHTSNWWAWFGNVGRLAFEETLNLLPQAAVTL